MNPTGPQALPPSKVNLWLLIPCSTIIVFMLTVVVYLNSLSQSSNIAGIKSKSTFGNIEQRAPQDEASLIAARASRAMQGLGAFQGMISGTLSDLHTQLEDVRDARSSELALPAVEQSLLTIKSFVRGLGVLPKEGKEAVANLVGTKLGNLHSAMDRVRTTPGVAESIKILLNQIKLELAALVG